VPDGASSSASSSSPSSSRFERSFRHPGACAASNPQRSS
jgi:hypothetical protein